MFFSLSPSFKLISITVLVISVLLFFWYFTGLRGELATVKENNRKLKESVISQKIVIDRMKKDFEQIQQINKDLEKEKESYRKDVKNLQDKFAKRDFGKITVRKPKLVENLVNRASENVSRCFELASGAPLNEKEKSAKTAREANNECPNLISGFDSNSVN